jgi:hypothetical protein
MRGNLDSRLQALQYLHIAILLLAETTPYKYVVLLSTLKQQVSIYYMH